MPAAVLINLDGTIDVGREPLPGALRAVRRLREAAILLRVLTNTTRKSRRELGRRLKRMGFEFAPAEIFNAPSGAARWLGRRGLMLGDAADRPRGTGELGRADRRAAGEGEWAGGRGAS
jgi:ribonucleotide monophosphatase NagD (HAD superfamily)